MPAGMQTIAPLAGIICCLALYACFVAGGLFQVAELVAGAISCCREPELRAFFAVVKGKGFEGAYTVPAELCLAVTYYFAVDR